MLRRLCAALLASVAVVALAACDEQASSQAAQENASEPTGSSTLTDSASASPNPASQALCSAVANAVGANTAWRLGDGTPGAQPAAGVALPACQLTQVEGDARTTLTVAYLPAGGQLSGAQVLAGLCQDVVGAKVGLGDRACAVPARSPADPGAELHRADLAAEDAGVLVLSFSSDEPSYRRSSVDDLEAVGQALAADPLLARAVG